nr:MAG TPA: hypothetical protein [Caudoviricetes sp.]
MGKSLGLCELLKQEYFAIGHFTLTGGCQLIRPSQITGLLSYHRSLPIHPPVVAQVGKTY